jgi:ABC-type transport system involved in multi-copper enzyme maturation permease subunit
LSGVILPGKFGGEEPVLTPPNFEKIDWMLIVKALFSLFAILLTYDAISGEKEQGTLALVCSNSISRFSILFGKYLAALITLLIPFFIGISLGLLTLEGQLGIFSLFSGESFARVFLFIVLSIIFISFFILLGLSVSSLTKRSSISLLLLFFIWVMLLFVIPNLSGIIADSIAETPSEHEFAIREITVFLSDDYDVEKQIKKKGLKPVVAELPSWLPPEATKAMSGQVYQASQEMIDEALKVWDEQGLQFASFYNEYRNAILTKQKLARNIARISPSAVFQFAGEKTTHCGFPRELSFFASAKDYYNEYVQYISDEVGERIIHYPRLPLRPIIVNIEGKEISIQIPFPKFSEKNIPQFSEKKPSIEESLYASLSDIALLFLWNVMVFFIGFIAFIRYDVRA